VAGVQSITATTDQLVGVVHATVSNPVIKVAALSAGVSRAVAHLPRDRSGSPMKSAFAIALGLGAGVLVGGYVVRQVWTRRHPRRPPGGRSRTGPDGPPAASSRTRLADAAAAGRAAAADREAQLRRDWEGLTPLSELARPRPGPGLR
jgi:hypothetical protein